MMASYLSDSLSVHLPHMLAQAAAKLFVMLSIIFIFGAWQMDDQSIDR